MFFLSLLYEKNQEIDIILCAHCLVKNIFIRNHIKTYNGKIVQCDAS
jgi:hypothetical protein